jgi:hypothetical protein
MAFILGFSSFIIWLSILSFLFHLAFDWFEKFIPEMSDIQQVEVINMPEINGVQKVEVLNHDEFCRK